MGSTQDVLFAFGRSGGVSPPCCFPHTRENAPGGGNRTAPARGGSAQRAAEPPRCVGCRKFLRTAAGECFCRDCIGGTAAVWGTGERICDPPPEAWHYCAGYDGPQISRDVWASRQE